MLRMLICGIAVASGITLVGAGRAPFHDLVAARDFDGNRSDEDDERRDIGQEEGDEIEDDSTESDHLESDDGDIRSDDDRPDDSEPDDTDRDDDTGASDKSSDDDNDDDHPEERDDDVVDREDAPEGEEPSPLRSESPQDHGRSEEDLGVREEESDRSVKVFRLANASATATARLLQQLYANSESGMRIAEDARTNSLFIIGRSDRLNEIGAVVEILDQNPDSVRPSGPAEHSDDRLQAGPTGVPAAIPNDPSRPVDQAADTETNRWRREFQRLDQQSAKTAVQLRRQSGDRSQTTAELLKTSLGQQLVQEVALAFAARQKLQQAELAQLKQRVARLQQAVESREQIRQAIIERRAEDLLNPAMQWAPEDSANRSTDRQPGPASQIEDRYVSQRDTDDVSGHDDHRTALRSSHVLRRQLQTLRSSVDEYQRDLRASPQNTRLQEALTEANRRLNLTWSELDAQLAIARLDLEEAELIARNRQQELHRAQELKNAGGMAAGEFAEIRLEVERSELALRRARKIYEMCEQIWMMERKASEHSDSKESANARDGSR